MSPVIHVLYLYKNGAVIDYVLARLTPGSPIDARAPPSPQYFRRFLYFRIPIHPGVWYCDVGTTYRFFGFRVSGCREENARDLIDDESFRLFETIPSPSVRFYYFFSAGRYIDFWNFNHSLGTGMIRIIEWPPYARWRRKWLETLISTVGMENQWRTRVATRNNSCLELITGPGLYRGGIWLTLYTYAPASQSPEPQSRSDP